jgi:cationic peptide transport system substrate-binding protein
LRANNRQEQFDQLPIGTGPFRFSSYKRDVIIRYERHLNYWREPAKVEKLIITINHDAALRFAKLVAGECDVIRDPLPAQIQAAKSMRHLQLTGRSSKALSYVVLNTRKEPLKSVHIRNAIALAIDRQKIIERVYHGEADIAATLYPFEKSDNLSSDAELPPQQLEGIPGIRSVEPIEIWTTYTPRPYNPSPLKMAELIQQDLIKLGLQTKIRSMEFNEFLRQLKKGNHSIALLGWIADIPHPDNFYTPLVSCSGIDGGNNFSFWCDEQLDQILSRAKNEKLWQQKLYLQVDAMIKKSSALIPIAFPKQNIIYNKRIHHLDLDHSGNILFYSANIAKRSGVKQ